MSELYKYKVLFITYCRAMFGANRSMLNLILDLRERYNIEPTVLLPAVIDGNLEEELMKYNIKYFSFKVKPWVVSVNARYKLLKRFSCYAKSAMFQRKILKGLQSQHFDLIYSNNSTIQTGRYLSKKMNIPHIWHVREFGREDYNIQFLYSNKLIKKYFSEADRIIAISESIENYIKKKLSKKDNVIRIYNGIDCNVERRTIFTNNTKMQFCCVGALSEGKNQIELLKATKILKNEGIKDFEIHFIGNGDEYKQKLEDYCVNNKIQECVHFHGYCKNVDVILDSMDVGVMCSRSEAFGRVTCEYMIHSMPVIGAESGGTCEIIDDRINGLLYTQNDEKDLAECMKLLICTPALIQQYAEKAYEKVLRIYNIKNNTDNIYKTIKELITNNGTRRG